VKPTGRKRGRPRKADSSSVREDLIVAATELFTEQGFAATSVDAVNVRAGVSKGAFYHHFSSKSELLDAVVERVVSQAHERIMSTIGTTGSALDRFNRMLTATRHFRRDAITARPNIERALHSPENAPLREKMRAHRIELAAPHVAAIIRQGVQEGVFSVEDPEAAARVFLLITQAVSDDAVLELQRERLPRAESRKRLLARLSAMYRAIEGLLAAPPGSLSSLDLNLVERWVNAFQNPPIQ
jgi:AcrR family transcriptional regulator